MPITSAPPLTGNWTDVTPGLDGGGVPIVPDLTNRKRVHYQDINAIAHSVITLEVSHNADGTIKISGGVGTAGSVPFIGASGVISQDNSNFFYDGTNHILRSPTIAGGSGTTSPLTLRSTTGVGTTGADIIFQTGSNGASEGMRLLNSGQFLVGTTAGNQGERLFVRSGTGSNGWAAQFINPHATAGDAVIGIGGGVTGSDSTTLLIAFYDSGGANVGNLKGSINRSGTSAVSYNTTSDKRIKRDIRPASIGLSDLLRLPVREFSFAADPDGERLTGFVAQELREIYPQAVTTNGDNGKGRLGDRRPWGVDYGRITPLLVKSIQELAARVAALEKK